MLVLTVVISVMAGLAFRRRFVGASLMFYLAIASLIMPGLLVSLGIGLMFQFLGIQPDWYTSALGAQLTWTLPFGLLIMFAVFSRFNRAYEEAARDLGACHGRSLRHVVLPILLPGIIAVALFGFTLSYDEFPRTLLTVGPRNTLPLEIWAMTTNVTSPALLRAGHRHHRGLLPGHHAGAGVDRPDPAPADAPSAGACTDRRVTRGILEEDERLPMTPADDSSSSASPSDSARPWRSRASISHVPHGSYCCLLGPQGCGKTTHPAHDRRA